MAPKTLQQLKAQRQKEHEKLAAASAAAGKSDAAVEAAAIAKRSFAGGKAGKVDALREEANASFAAHDYPRALELYNQAILLDGKNALLHCNRSAAFCAMRNFALALKDADSALRWAPNSAKAHYRRGYALEQLWKYPEAFEEYCLAVKLDPKSELFRDAHTDTLQLLAHLKLSQQSPSAMALISAAAKAAAGAAAKQHAQPHNGSAAAGAGADAAANGSGDAKDVKTADAKADAKSAPAVAGPAVAGVAEVPPAGAAGEMDRFEQMLKWLRDGGAKFPKLYLQYYGEDYRGVHTLTKINTDENVVFVPLNYIMTSEVARDSEICKLIDKSGADVRSKHTYLAAYLLQERQRSTSHWHPYIRVLPAHYNNVPINFPAEKKRWLQGSMCVQKIDERIEALKYEYKIIADRVPAFAAFKFEDFVWARLVVITRIFGLVINGLKTDGLVPYADMLNHKRPRETKWAYEDSYGGFLITALKTIHRGDQVFDSYGRKCNSRFFVNYGFALEQNEDNEAVVHVGLRQDDPLYGSKLQLFGLQPHTNGVKECQVPATYDDAKTKEMFSFLRVAYAAPSELQDITTRMRGKDQLKLDAIEALSAANEMAVLATLRNAALQSLAAFETSLADDNKLLAEHAADPSRHPALNDSNVRNCVVVRRGEKEVLQWYVDLCERATPYLRLSYNALCRRAAQHVKNTTPFDHYVMTVVFPLLKRS